MILEQMNHWHWWVFAVVLLILEVFAPGAFFMWMGAAAGVVGLLVLVFSIGWKLQWLVFAVVSVASILAWRAHLKKHPTQTEQPRLNRRGEQYIGRHFTLSEPIVNGLGKIRVDDSTWKIEGADCEAGSRVVVTGVDGVILKVERPAE